MSQEHKRIVKLQSGGSITICGTFDLFDMASNVRDRRLITDLVNLLDNYESNAELLSITFTEDATPKPEQRD